ncbi:MAG TPA: sigma-70 family RNA polymerase sigma factor [Acidimicrobiales bacterium]|nr:sigma-70 family RNA polymerase sigma factor [Acidimicrobiales bacterium]
MWEASDEALLAGYATGDRGAASVFVRRFQGKVTGLALMMTHDRALADEVAQDAFVRAWRYAASYDPRRGAVGGWLLGIVRNVALDRLRVAQRSRLVAVGPSPEDLPDGEVPDTADAVGERDQVARLVALLDDLPAEQRATLLAVTLNGLSTREVSERDGVPLGTVKTRLRLALHKVRDRLGAEVP